MTDQAEEQEMEAEALQAIFDTHFTILGPQKWQVEIYPEMTADPDKLHELNHVGIKLIVDLPSDYPESAPPKLECEIIKGLVEEHRQELIGLANEEAAANEGVPSIFAVAERLREWLTENNQKGLDDLSMHAQMIRKQLAKEKEVGSFGGDDNDWIFHGLHSCILLLLFFEGQYQSKTTLSLSCRNSWVEPGDARIDLGVVKILFSTALS